MNCDNFLSDKSSTRVHAPPGGRSSMASLLFGGPEPTPVVRQSNKKPIEEEEEEVIEAPVTSSVTSETKTATPAPVKAPFVESTKSLEATSNNKKQNGGSYSSNSFANGANQNSGNFISERPTTRIHAAPGGRSSMKGIFDHGY